MPASMTGPYVCGLGWILCDNVVEVTEFPKENEKSEASAVWMQVGGPVPRALMTVTRLGGTASLLGAVGSDCAGDLVMEELSAFDVGRQLIARVPDEATRGSFVVLTPGGRRTIVYSGVGADPDGLSRDAVREIEHSAALHLDGRLFTLALAAVKVARSAGVPICIDAGSSKPGLSELLRLCDHVVIPKRTLLEVTGERSIVRGVVVLMARGTLSTCTVTVGSAGSVAWDADGNVHAQEAHRVRAVDTNGAGDTFAGGLLFGVMNQLALPDRLRMAAACAALKCTHLGNQGLPTMLEVQKLMVNIV